jgi:hypothetical protein
MGASPCETFAGTLVGADAREGEPAFADSDVPDGALVFDWHATMSAPPAMTPSLVLIMTRGPASSVPFADHARVSKSFSNLLAPSA